jgi:A/G-specific adenine glycosylase
MLQQTRVEAVIPYFERWMARFPTLERLANASEKEVLSAWEGLGYYSRARNLQRAARMVVEEYGSQLPREVSALRKLPGIGHYTAGAIASIAFGLDQPTLDGNLRRVLARLFDVRQAADTPAGDRILWELAAENLPHGQAGDYNQALMDLGATVCLPKKPHCSACPLVKVCQARARGVQEQRPVLKPKRKVPHYVQVAAVIVRDGQVLITRRPTKGLLGGMWEFPNGRVEGEPALELETVIETGYNLSVRVGDPLGMVKHAYTHFRVTEYAYLCEAISIKRLENLEWVEFVRLADYPMGKIDRQIAGLARAKTLGTL